jgi:hypothetical protein
MFENFRLLIKAQGKEGLVDPGMEFRINVCFILMNKRIIYYNLIIVICSGAKGLRIVQYVLIVPPFRFSI